MSRSLSRALLVGALAGLALFGALPAGAETTMQGSNNADGSTAVTGTSSGTSVATFTGGPAATGPTSSAQQNGTNSAALKQSGTAKTGDAVAGAAVHGAVDDDVTIQHQNTSIDSVAVSGVAAITNVGTVILGPTSDGTAQQIGDNDADLVQEAIVATGDAVANAQVAGIVGEGEHTVQMTNNADCGGGDCATSGDAVATNVATAILGPSAETSVSQTGDNDAVVDQSVDGDSGDALNGSQVTGIVGGSSTVQNTNNSVCGGTCATSGVVSLTNVATVLAGPTASTTGADASAQQLGDNGIDVTQASDALSGDALSGAQVTGVVTGDDEEVTIQNTNTSDGDEVDTGVAVATNVATAIAGPQASTDLNASTQQTGDNDIVNDQTANALTGDGVAGSQITGAVAGDSAEVTVQNSNSAGAGSTASGFSGDAVAGAQVTGVVTGDDSTTDIQLSNNAASAAAPALATADFSLGVNTAVLDAGPVASGTTGASTQQTGDNSVDSSQVGNDVATLVASAAPMATSTGNASASQLGDDSVVASQENVSASGDAVAGSQVTGLVQGDGSDGTVQATNTSEDSLAISGDIPIVTTAVATVGPLADGDAGATANQVGDDTADITQSTEAATGDAVAGSQVTGVVGGDTAEVQVSNNDTASAGLSGIADGVNVATGTLGPVATAAGVGASASAQQSGDTGATVDQDLSSEAGDALSGAQVSGRA